MSLRSLLRSVVKWIRPPRRVEPELRITPEQLRAALSEMLSDPETRRLVLRDLVGTAFPISGGQPTCDTEASQVKAGTFGASGCQGNYSFMNSSVGIGTTAPGRLLHISRSDTGIAGIKLTTNANDWYIDHRGENEMPFNRLAIINNAATEVFTILQTGKVGVGTTAPNAKLSVGSGSLDDTNLPVQISTGGIGTVAYYGANKNGGYGVLFGFENQGALGTGGIVRVVSGDPLMFFVNNTIEAMRITSAGNVGIGRTDRLSRLTVRGRASFTATGTVSTNMGSPTVTGSATAKFVSEVGVGDRVTIGSETRIVTHIASDTSLTVQANFGATNSGVSMTVLPSLFRTDDANGKAQVAVSDQGHLAFLKSNDPPAAGGATEMWRSDDSEAPEKIHLQTQTGLYTLLAIKAPPPSLPGTDREATLTLGRDLTNGAEFLDFYNNGYPTETQYGIRIQKRGTGGQYRDFIFDKHDGSTNPKVKLLVIKTESGNVGIGDKATPAAKLDVFGGDIYVSSAGNGVILKSPDGTKCKRVYIDNAGALQTADVTPCP